MGTVTVGDESLEYLWPSDVEFDGIRLEAYDLVGEFWFDVSAPEAGRVTVNTFSREGRVDVIAAAVELALQRL